MCLTPCTVATEFSISDDSLTYTFKLRPGVTFHNGEPLTGNDVIESWQMIMNPDFGAFNTNGWDKVKDITLADDGMTVVMTCTEVQASFLSYIASGACAILPASEFAKGIDNFMQQLRATLEDDPRNPKWFQTVRGIGYRFDG